MAFHPSPMVIRYSKGLKGVSWLIGVACALPHHCGASLAAARGRPGRPCALDDRQAMWSPARPPGAPGARSGAPGARCVVHLLLRRSRRQLLAWLKSPAALPLTSGVEAWPAWLASRWSGAAKRGWTAWLGRRAVACTPRRWPAQWPKAFGGTKCRGKKGFGVQAEPNPWLRRDRLSVVGPRLNSGHSGLNRHRSALKSQGLLPFGSLAGLAGWPDARLALQVSLQVS